MFNRNYLIAIAIGATALTLIPNKLLYKHTELTNLVVTGIRKDEDGTNHVELYCPIHNAYRIYAIAFLHPHIKVNSILRDIPVVVTKRKIRLSKHTTTTYRYSTVRKLLSQATWS